MSETFEYELGDPEEGIPPKGAAYVQCVNVKQAYSKAGNPMWVFDFKLLRYMDRAVAEKGDSFAGYEMTVYCALTRKAEFKVRQVIAALGGDPKQTKVKFTRESVAGIVCLAEIVHDEYNGQIRAQLGDMAPHPQEPGKKEPVEQTNPFPASGADESFGGGNGGSAFA